MKRKPNQTKELAEELDVFDNMLTALVEILEEKGIITQKEWENKIKSKIETKKGKSYRRIQFPE